MGGLITLISNVAGIVSGWLGLQSKKLDLKNSAEMQDAARKQDEQNAVDKTNQAIARKDVDELRKEIAE